MATGTDWSELTTACKEAMRLAGESPGLCGGRYVGRRYDKKAKRTVFVVLEDDDPEKYRDDQEIDILAHVQPTKVWPIGYARHYLQADGTVEFPGR